MKRTWQRWLTVGVGLGLGGVLEVNGAATVWHLETPATIGGHATEVLGAPAVIASPFGPAIGFDGVDDALLVPVNPVAGWKAFTIEILFTVAPDGSFEQRFLHLGSGTEDRALIELRLTPERTWYLDGFLRSGANQLALIDATKLHPAGRWAWAALRYDGKRMSIYVNGVVQGEGDVQLDPLPPGRASLGVRMTRISWFKGAIREVRFHDSALAGADLQRVAD